MRDSRAQQSLSYPLRLPDEAQAERKKQFTLILPILSQGMMQPKTETKRTGKHRKTMKQALADLREENTDGGSAVELQRLIEQACNFYLAHGWFPETYEQVQAIPVQQAAVLPYAAGDGGTMGQSYRLLLDRESKRSRSLSAHPLRQARGHVPGAKRR